RNHPSGADLETIKTEIKKELPFVKSHVALSVLVMGYLLSLTLLLQGLSGAYATEFGSHPDEAAHYVTGVMVYDYLSRGLNQPPMEYAFNYYDHYPKVAIGHWPPGFYAAFGTWALLFSPSRLSTLMFMAFITAVMAFFLFVIVRSRVGVYWGLGCATLLILVPLVQKYTASVMVDTAIALLCLLTAVAFIQYLEKPRLIFALAFGTFAAAAVLTKQSGVLMALVIFLAMLLSRRIELLKHWTFWVGSTIAIAISVPWLLFNYQIVKDAWTDPWGLPYTIKALPLFVKGMANMLGYPLLFAAGVGFASVCVKALRNRGGVAPLWAVAVSLPVGVIVFHSIVPASIDDRYLISALPGVLLLTIGGVSSLTEQLSRRFPQMRRTARWTLFLLIFGLFMVGQFEIPQKRFEGFGPIVDRIMSEGSVTGEHILVSSDSRGEGALIAELTMAETQRPNHVVHRGSKVLSSSDWMGRDYAPRFKSDSGLIRFLEQSAINWVVVDETVSGRMLREHHMLVGRALRYNTRAFTEVDNFPIKRGSPDLDGSAILYRRTGIARTTSGTTSVVARSARSVTGAVRNYLSRIPPRAAATTETVNPGVICMCDDHDDKTARCGLKAANLE
ncbi:MAG: glycosyltransferase family 39 protein, partial [Candidatus Latescibacterota bacterium]